MRRRPWRLNDAPALLPRAGDRLHHLGPLDSFRMPRRRSMVSEPIGVYQQ
jgi:hypothetical protein